MKAVLLAGGRGERLRPITDTRPKPLVPVLARPVMDYVLSLLAHHGVDETIVTTHYLADQIRRRYGDEAFGIRLSYAVEQAPLGTAGGVKQFEDKLQKEEMFLVMSGDALCDFDLSRAAAFHRAKGADVTIILSSVKTPLEYGVVLSDAMERIFAFSEKPDWSETFSDQVNTGVYFLSPRVLRFIPEGKPFDFASDLFPMLLREGYSLFGYKDEGYWCDIGKIPSLYRCSRDLLQGKAQTFLPLEGAVRPGGDGKGPVFISDRAVVEEGAEVQDFSVVSPGVHLKKGSRVTGSLILENVEIEKDAVASGAIVCENSRLEQGAVVLPDTVVGASCRLAPGASPERGARLAPGAELSAPPAFSEEEGFVFTEEGAARGPAPGLTEEEAERLGTAFAEAYHSEILVMWDEKKKASSGYALLFSAGVLRGGRNALLVGDGSRREAMFAASYYHLPAVFISDGGAKGLFFVYGRDGIPLTRAEVLRLARLAENAEKAPFTGSLLRKGEVRQAYIDSLAALMGNGAGKKIALTGTGEALVRRAAEQSGFEVYSPREDHIFVLEIFPNSLKLSYGSEHLGDTEKIRLFLIEEEIGEGRTSFVLPRTAPAFFSEHIRARGGSVQTVSLGHTTLAEDKARKEALERRWLFDTAHLAARLLRTIAGTDEKKLCARFRAAPEIYISELYYYPEEETKARLLSRAETVLKDEKNIRLDPGFFSIRIVSEALSFEAALDHAFETRGKLNEIEQKIRGK